MAILHPDVKKTEVAFPSQAEEQVYQMSSKLSDEWRVYHSVTLSMREEREGVKDGEIDFVFYHPAHGIIVVEVKGGRISLDGETGQFYSLNRHGRSFLIKNPFQQAIVWRNRFVRFLRSNQIHVPVSHAVCFPQVDESEFPVHTTIEPSVLLGRRGLENLDSFLKDVSRSFHRDDFLKFNDVAAGLDRLLIGTSFESKQLLREYIDTHEAKIKESDLMHDAIVSPVTGVQRLGVEGEAGTGKTVLAMTLARHFRDQGQKVLYIVSSPLLAARISSDMGAGVEVRGIQDLASSYGVSLLVTPTDWTLTPQDYVQVEAPERLRKALEASTNRYDVLIVDEAQDIQPYWWVALESLLEDPAQSKLYTFFDRDQGVFGGADENENGFKPEDTLPVPTNYMRLHRNYRNTRQISEFSRGFRRSAQTHIAATSDRAGFMPVLIRYKDSADAKNKIAELVRELTDDLGVNDEEIMLLSGRAPENKDSVLAGTDTLSGLKITKLSAERLRESRPTKFGEIGIATIASFKGLESKVVIAFNLSEYNLPPEHPIMSSLMYVAMTRAKHMLYVFVKEDDAKDEMMTRLYKNVTRGAALVLSAEERAGERSGTVIHYNPERAGVIVLDSGTDQTQDTILLFGPDLRRAGILSLKREERLLFRVRSEGGVAFAVDIRRDETPA
jgi:Nuclease-related domain/UvrD-like helicase C-terminal domain/AAA domain